jgi:hypothetical protein
MKIPTSLNSRKLLFAVWTDVVLLVAGLGCVRWPALVPIYDTLSTGLLSVAAMYIVGNVSTKWVNGRLVAGQPAPQKKKED